MTDSLVPLLDDPKPAVLFVDDEPKVLNAMERALRSRRREWSMGFATGGLQALEILEHLEFDVIVTDMQMPGMDGVELMRRLIERHPRVIRIVLSGHAEREVVVQAMGLAHQYLRKPCPTQMLTDRLQQTLRFRQLIESPMLKAVLARVRALRAVPPLYAAVLAELQRPHVSTAKVAEIVASDPGMTTKMLQVINSAYFGLRAPVLDPLRAVQLLGLETVQSLVLTIRVFEQFEDGGAIDRAALWRHSLRTARIASGVATQLGLDEDGVASAFTAGLLHDIGKLILADSMPRYKEVMADARARDVDEVAAERQAFGAGHAEIGSYLLGLWGLPFSIMEAIGWHHAPAASGVWQNSPITAVHVANALDHEAHGSGSLDVLLDGAYLCALGFNQRPASWAVLAQSQAAL